MECEENNRERLIEQRSFAREKPRGIEPKTTQYLRLVPKVSGKTFELHYVVDRQAFGVGGEDCLEKIAELDPQPEKDKTDPTDINIREDGYVVIELDDCFEWRWSADLAGISTKTEPYENLYGEVRYAEKLGDRFRKKEDFPEDAELRIMRFLAKYDGPPDKKAEEGRQQPYCLNLEFRQPGARTGWLPMTLDPLFNNPPKGNTPFWP